MAKKMLIDASHAEETRVVVADGNKVEEFDFESITKRQLAGNIYLAKVTRVEPSLQAAFVDYGGNRHGFLAFSEIHPDYYQIPVEDRKKLIEEEEALDRSDAEAEESEDAEASKPAPKRRRRKSAPKSQAEAAGIPDEDEVVSSDDGANDDDASLLVETPEDKAEEKPKPKRRRTRKKPVEETTVEDAEGADASGDAAIAADAADEAAVTEPAADAEATPEAAKAEKPKSRTRSRRKKSSDDETSEPVDVPENNEASPVDDIEQIASDDVHEEVRRKPRPRRYKIQEVIKVRQILLVQVVKEERGNKGAALTTYLSLAGRYCVLMPNTARGGGISRKITNPADRKKLKEIASEIEVPQGAGLIVRTAGAKRTKTEIKRDYEYLLRLWEEIRELTLSSIAPRLIYEEGNLIKRSIRDLYNRDIDEILVEGEHGYKEAKEYMKMLLPSHAKNVKLYNDPNRLFARYQVENYLSGMLNPTVQLRSGGYIVIGVTEALVAIDVNSGRATKEGSIEDTAVKTNLEAAEEIARQMRLRDLAGLIVIDFIDMEERRNNNAVEKRLKDCLKSDRARIQIGRISGFGLLEMSRQRLRPGMLEATTTQCPHCYGTGYIRSNESVALAIIRELEEEGSRNRAKEVLVKVSINVANYMLNQKREHVTDVETRYGLSIRVEADPAVIGAEFTLERLKHATRIVPQPTGTSSAVTVDLASVPEAVEEEAPEAEDTNRKPRKRRRRRRGGRGGSDSAQDNAQETGQEASADADANSTSETDAPASPEPVADTGDSAAEVVAENAAEPAAEVEKPAPAKRPRRSRKKADAEADTAKTDDAAAAVEPEAEEKPKPKKRATRSRKKAVEATEDTTADAGDAAPDAKSEPVADVEPVAEPSPEPAAQPEPVAAEAAPEEEAKPAKRKRSGWWARAIGK